VVVLSRKFAFENNGDNLTLYKTLRKLNPSPYMYHLKQDTKTIIGASPEMLVRITDDKVETFPIAGTRKITDDENKNKQLADELFHTCKLGQYRFAPNPLALYALLIPFHHGVTHQLVVCFYFHHQ